MRQRKLVNETAQRLVDETLNLIAEKGGLTDVNLRQISKRAGCAHTNVYNYFNDFEGLTWAAYDDALDIYREALMRGLETGLSGRDFFLTLVGNMINFAKESTGLHRFISSDPINIENISDEILGKIVILKQFYLDVFYSLAKGNLSRKKSDEAADVLLAYIDGETFNLINYRYLPEDDILSRVLKNVEMLFQRLTSNECDGVSLKQAHSRKNVLVFPELPDETER